MSDPTDSVDGAVDSAVGDADAVDLTRPADPVADAAVRSALAALPSPAMPAAVWERLAATLADEQRARDPDDPSVAFLGARAQRREAARHRRTRVLAGVAAAGLVVVAGGVALTALRGGGAGPAPVAGGLPAAEGAGAAAPALRVLQTGTRYSQDGFGQQVRDLLGRDEVEPAVPLGLDAESDGAPVTEFQRDVAPVGSDGFTASWGGIRGCVSGLVTATQVGQAIVVDRATFEGRDAGVVVLAADETPTTVDVWVVEPGCGQGDPRVLFFFRAPVGG